MNNLHDYANAYELGKWDASYGLPRRNTFVGIERDLYDEGYTDHCVE